MSVNVKRICMPSAGSSPQGWAIRKWRQDSLLEALQWLPGMTWVHRVRFRPVGAGTLPRSQHQILTPSLFNKLGGREEQELKVYIICPLSERAHIMILAPPNSVPKDNFHVLCWLLLQGEQLFYLWSEIAFLRNRIRGRQLLIRMHAVLYLLKWHYGFPFIQ